jgi:hypothetical protein
MSLALYNGPTSVGSFAYFLGTSTTLFVHMSDYNIKSYLHGYDIGIYIRLHLVIGLYCDYMFVVVNRHFKVNSRHFLS